MKHGRIEPTSPLLSTPSSSSSSDDTLAGSKRPAVGENTTQNPSSLIKGRFSLNKEIVSNSGTPDLDVEKKPAGQGVGVGGSWPSIQLESDTGEHPQGIRLLVIVAALVLSVFLVFLDNVSNRSLLGIPTRGSPVLI